jgi:co-chaperonin GroES (HSP10)
MENNKVAIRVLRDFIAVQEVKATDKEASVIEIVRLGDDRMKKGVVVAVGSGCITANGQSHKIEVDVGEVVFFDTTNSQQLNHAGQKYYILNELSVRAVLLPQEGK